MTTLPIIYCEVERKLPLSDTITGRSLAFESFLAPFLSRPKLAASWQYLWVQSVVSCHLGKKREGFQRDSTFPNMAVSVLCKQNCDECVGWWLIG